MPGRFFSILRPLLLTIIPCLSLVVGCSIIPQPTKPAITPDPTAQAIFNEYVNRKQYDKLDAEILATIPDPLLLQAIDDYAWHKIDKNYDQADQILSKLAKGFQAFFYIRMLEGEVNNGGYNQYFFNSSGQYAFQALDGLKLIGAEEHVANLQKAIAIHLREQDDPKLRKLYEDRSLESFSKSYKYTKLDECDDEFYDLSDKLDELRIKFVRDHPDLFTGD